jgi:hypothetical protein
MLVRARRRASSDQSMSSGESESERESEREGDEKDAGRETRQRRPRQSSQTKYGVPITAVSSPAPS